jgi:hypothetical protein
MKERNAASLKGGGVSSEEFLCQATRDLGRFGCNNVRQQVGGAWLMERLQQQEPQWRDSSIGV